MKTDTFDNIDKSTVTEDKTKEAMENGGLPKGIHTEAQLWDEILKKEVLEMPFLLLPVIAEAHGKSYPADTKITPVGTEYSVERIVTKDISSIRSDATIRIESQLFLLIPFTPIRFRKLTARSTRKTQNYNSDSAKLELANFFHEIIILLDEATLAGTICEIDRKDILALLRKAMIRVFHEDPFLSEVVNHMTAPVLELERETIARLQRENEALRSERGAEKSRMDAEKSKMDAEKSRMNAEMDALRSERDALKSQNIALITEVEALRAPKGPFRSWRKRLKRNH